MGYSASVYIAAMSLWAFAAMGYDKRQAKSKKQRTPEKSLWLIALLGGGIGAYAGMYVFRHKTRRIAFRIGFFGLALIDLLFLLWLWGIRLPFQ